MAAPRLRSPLTPITLYETDNNMLLVGQHPDARPAKFSVLKIGRESPVTTADHALRMSDDGTVYDQKELNQMLRREAGQQKDPIAGNTLAPKMEQIEAVAGFIKLLENHYMLVVTKTRGVADFFGGSIRTIEKTTWIRISKPPPPSQASKSNQLRALAGQPLAVKKEGSDEKKYREILTSLSLETGFFCCRTYDLTKSLQTNMLEHERLKTPPNSSGSTAAATNIEGAGAGGDPGGSGSANDEAWIHPVPCNDMFAWNTHLVQPILAAGKAGSGGSHSQRLAQRWVMPIIHGYAEQRQLSLVDGRQLTVTLIGRRSRFFAGTRYLRRGCSTDGDVANEVETEQILALSPRVVKSGRKTGGEGITYSSMVQVRGSIPIFWHHTNLMAAKPDVKIESVDPEYRVTRRHFNRLFERYGKHVTVLSLIRQNEKKPLEALLGSALAHAVASLNQSLSNRRSVRSSVVAASSSWLVSSFQGDGDGSAAGMNGGGSGSDGSEGVLTSEEEGEEGEEGKEEKQGKEGARGGVQNQRERAVESPGSSHATMVPAVALASNAVDTADASNNSGSGGSEEGRGGEGDGKSIDEIQQLRANFKPSQSGRHITRTEVSAPPAAVPTGASTTPTLRPLPPPSSPASRAATAAAAKDVQSEVPFIKRLDQVSEAGRLDERHVTSNSDEAAALLPIDYLTYDLISHMKANQSASVFDALAQISDTIFPQIGLFYAPAGVGAALLDAAGYRGAHNHPPRSGGGGSGDETEREIRVQIMDRVLEADRQREGGIAKRGGRRAWNKPLLQFGVLRTNCVDCLDRTNVAQFSYAKRSLTCQLEAFGLALNAPSLAELESNLMAMWAEHGDQMARQYGGSGAMHKVDQGVSSSSSSGQENGEREFVLTGGAKNAVVAVERYYSNNVTDKEKQMAINLFLGVYEPGVAGKAHLWDTPLQAKDQTSSSGASGFTDGGVDITTQQPQQPLFAYADLSSRPFFQEAYTSTELSSFDAMSDEALSRQAATTPNPAAGSASPTASSSTGDMGKVKVPLVVLEVEDDGNSGEVGEVGEGERGEAEREVELELALGLESESKSFEAELLSFRELKTGVSSRLYVGRDGSEVKAQMSEYKDYLHLKTMMGPPPPAPQVLDLMVDGAGEVGVSGTGALARDSHAVGGQGYGYDTASATGTDVGTGAVVTDGAGGLGNPARGLPRTAPQWDTAGGQSQQPPARRLSRTVNALVDKEVPATFVPSPAAPSRWPKALKRKANRAAAAAAKERANESSYESFASALEREREFAAGGEGTGDDIGDSDISGEPPSGGSGGDVDDEAPGTSGGASEGARGSGGGTSSGAPKTFMSRLARTMMKDTA